MWGAVDDRSNNTYRSSVAEFRLKLCPPEKLLVSCSKNIQLCSGYCNYSMHKALVSEIPLQSSPCSWPPPHTPTSKTTAITLCYFFFLNLLAKKNCHRRAYFLRLIFQVGTEPINLGPRDAKKGKPLWIFLLKGKLRVSLKYPCLNSLKKSSGPMPFLLPNQNCSQPKNWCFPERCCFALAAPVMT